MQLLKLSTSCVVFMLRFTQKLNIYLEKKHSTLLNKQIEKVNRRNYGK